MVDRSHAAGLLRGAAAAAMLAATYRLIFRDHCLTWGATDDEVQRPMPGDDLLPAAGIVTTRAVTVRTAPADVWPWLVHMGPGRGGAYTYDWIENLLGLDMHSADEIRPELQHLAVGDIITMGTGPAMRVAHLELERALAFRSEDGRWVWAFGLYPAVDGTVRLVSRNRIAVPSAPLARLFFTVVMEPGRPDHGAQDATGHPPTSGTTNCRGGGRNSIGGVHDSKLILAKN